jgi:hypothetical protein
MLEYDFSGQDVIRGKYAKMFPPGCKVVTIQPDVAKLFPDSESVNKALRALGQIISDQARAKPRSRSKRTAAAK